MDLPNELILNVLERLYKADLKSVRLLSNTWSACAAPLLFDQLYISSSKEDLEVFEAITKHSTLSKYIRRLIYDGSEFLPNIPKEHYISEVYEQSYLLCISTKDTPLNDPDPEIKNFCDDVALRHEFDDLLSKYEGSGFIRSGYQDYTEHAIQQQNVLRNGKFLQRFVRGLEQLDSLTMVSLKSGWPYINKDLINGDLARPATGSPLQRSWTPFRCNPSSWIWEPRDPYRSGLPSMIGPDGRTHYNILTKALVQAQRLIKVFEVPECSCEGLPCTAFQKSDHRTRSRIPDIEAFAKLERLVLRLAFYGETEEGPLTTHLFNDLTGLRELLGSLEYLKHLDLRLSINYEYPPIFYTYEQVFPVNKFWPSLQSLVLMNLSIKATDLLHLLEIRMPNLSYFEIGDIRLEEGTWEGVLECMKRSGRLSTFRIDSDAYLFHCDGEEFRRLGDKKDRLYLEIEHYVSKGGRHPCLKDTQANCDAQKFVDDMHRVRDTEDD